jgi:hypothetical protein
LFDTENAKMTELIGAGMAITDATLDREKRDEREVAFHEERTGPSATSSRVLPKFNTGSGTLEE